MALISIKDAIVRASARDKAYVDEQMTKVPTNSEFNIAKQDLQTIQSLFPMPEKRDFSTARLGTILTTGVVNNNYKYALLVPTVTVKGNETFAEVNCEGYYIRMASVIGSTLVKFSDFTKDSNRLEITEGVTYRFCIAKVQSPSSSSTPDLTNSEVEDILSKLVLRYNDTTNAVVNPTRVDILESSVSTIETEVADIKTRVTNLENGTGENIPSQPTTQIKEEQITGNAANPSTFSWGTGIVTTAGKPNTSYTYGITSAAIPLTSCDSFKIVCEGWLMRIAIWNKKYNESDAIMLKYIDYTQDLLEIPYEEGYAYMYIGVRKDTSVTTALSDDEKTDIQSKIKIYSCTIEEVSGPIGGGIGSLASTCNIDINTVPSSQGALNCIKRCRQLTDIKWTPVADLKRISIITGSTYSDTDSYSEAGTTARFWDVFKAGVEYTGIPYSRARRDSVSYGYDFNNTDMFDVGTRISLETFVTSVRNPNSLLMTDSKVNNDLGGNAASIYGTVCNGFVSYAWDLDDYTGITELSRLCTKVGDVSTIDLKRIKLADMLWLNGSHTAIITDLFKDSNGNITAIEVSEATKFGNTNPAIQGSQFGGICRRKTWDVEYFLEWWASFSIYRYNNLESITFTPSRFVDVEKNKHSICYPDLPCIPYCGNKFVYKAGKIPNATIILNTNAYSFLRVKKNGNNWNCDGSNNAYTVAGNVVNVDFNEVGTYEAYLFNVVNGIETISRSCHWVVE